MPLQIDQITPTLTATISIYATNNTRIPPLRQPYPPNHLIIPHSTVLSVSRREQSQPVETNTALSRRQCPIRGTSRSFSPPPPSPSAQPEPENATTSSISREGASVFQSASSPFVSLFPQLHPLHPYANLFCPVRECARVYARPPTPTHKAVRGLLALVVGAAERVIN